MAERSVQESRPNKKDRVGRRESAMQGKNARTIGIVWYERDSYAEARGVMEDAQVLPRAYETWLRAARSVIQLEHAKGSDIVKATIDPDAFFAWCLATGQRADALARTRHVNLAIDDYCSVSAASDYGQELVDHPREPYARDVAHPQADVRSSASGPAD
jgi:hypothetical protein